MNNDFIGDSPVQEVGSVLKVMLWGGAAIILFRLFKATESQTRKKDSVDKILEEKK